MLSQFPSSTSLLFHPALPPSQPRHPCPQCLAVATLISLKLLQKKKKGKKKHKNQPPPHLEDSSPSVHSPNVGLQPWRVMVRLAHPALHRLHSLKDSRRK